MPRIFHLLRGLPDPAIDLALAEALPTAAPAAMPSIVEALLERRRMPAAAALIEQYHRLTPPLREKVALAAPGLTRAIRKAAAATGSPAAENALDLIKTTPLPSLSYLVTGILRRGDAPRRAAAAEVLLALARRCGGAGSDRLAPAEAAHVGAAVAEAIAFYAQHRQPRAVTAWLCLSSQRFPALEQVFADPRHPGTVAVREMLEAAATPQARRALLAAVRFPTLERAAATGLRRSAARGRLEDALAGGACLAWPDVAAAVGRVERSEQLWPAPAVRQAWLPQAQRHLASWAVSLPGEPETRCHRLAGLATLDDPFARLTALRRLIQSHQAGPQQAAAATAAAIGRFVDDAQASIARLAARHLIRAASADLPRQLARWCNSRHISVAQLAERALAPIGFQRLWSGWAGLSAERRLALGRVLIKIDPNFHAALGARLSRADPAERVRALSIIAELGQGAFFEEELIRLTRGDRPRVVATAVRALGSTGSDQAVRATAAALDHADPRVRANAVEALSGPAQATHPDAVAVLGRVKRMTGDAANRPRANAIHAVLRLVGTDSEGGAEARQALDRMLGDRRAAHRLSALWLVESEAMVDQAARVAEMVVGDADQRVQARAKRAFDRMLAWLDPNGGGSRVSPSDAGALAKIAAAEPASGVARQGAA